MVKKILPAGMAVLVAAGALAGCGTSETQGTASGAQNASAAGRRWYLRIPRPRPAWIPR